MLRKENRLKSNRSFNATYRNNNSFSDNSIVLYTGQEKTDRNCPTRVGFVVSKKIHKRAVIRNKIKRLMRENVRQMIKNNSFNDDYQSIILMARTGIKGKNYSEIKEAISNLLNKIAN